MPGRGMELDSRGPAGASRRFPSCLLPRRAVHWPAAASGSADEPFTRIFSRRRQVRPRFPSLAARIPPPLARTQKNIAMKNALVPSIRRGLIAALFSLPLLSAAAAPARGTGDRAAEILASRGSLPATSAGPHVEIGTFRIQVAAKLGRPDATLADGTWLYHRRKALESAAEGTLVICFSGGRVSALSLATPATVATLRAGPRQPDAQDLVAAK